MLVRVGVCICVIMRMIRIVRMRMIVRMVVVVRMNVRLFLPTGKRSNG